MFFVLKAPSTQEDEGRYQLLTNRPTYDEAEAFITAEVEKSKGWHSRGSFVITAALNWGTPPVVMPARMTPEMENVWRAAFFTHCRRRMNCGPKKAPRILADSAEQVAYRELVKHVQAQAEG